MKCERDAIVRCWRRRREGEEGGRRREEGGGGIGGGGFARAHITMEESERTATMEPVSGKEAVHIRHPCSKEFRKVSGPGSGVTG